MPPRRWRPGRTTCATRPCPSGWTRERTRPKRAGHGVDVMLKIYAKCIGGRRETANQRIEGALTA
ncbi:hypothetical protein Pve01_07240 [Planomonospora venezuelensis]|nr:hypothetical protein Pve01_07240 [Planomonospora venezuelensis]